MFLFLGGEYIEDAPDVAASHVAVPVVPQVHVQRVSAWASVKLLAEPILALAELFELVEDHFPEVGCHALAPEWSE